MKLSLILQWDPLTTYEMIKVKSPAVNSTAHQLRLRVLTADAVSMLCAPRQQV